MKLSRPGRPIPKGFKVVGPHQVMMDGRPLKHVLRVDTCAGVAWVVEHTEDGRVQMRNFEPVIRRVYGPMKAIPILSEYP